MSFLETINYTWKIKDEIISIIKNTDIENKISFRKDIFGGAELLIHKHNKKQTIKKLKKLYKNKYNSDLLL